MKGGDGFPEMVREVVGSEKVSTQLLLGLLMGRLSGKEVADSMKQSHDKSGVSSAILENVTAFETPLMMLYWGIQVGRRLQSAESAALGRLEHSGF